jgi:hypothetical protein
MNGPLGVPMGAHSVLNHEDFGRIVLTAENQLSGKLIPPTLLCPRPYRSLYNAGMRYDLIAWQDTNDGMNLVVARSRAGLDWMFKCMPNGESPGDFLRFIESIPKTLRVGVIDPTGKILNFTSGLLH